MKKPKWTYGFYINYTFRWIPLYYRVKELMWKDKYDTPRCEIEPQVRIEWLWWEFYAVQGNDQYWEQWLWVNKYCDGDYEKGKSTWGWVNGTTKESTWIDF
jgi:hypothetical protein